MGRKKNIEKLKEFKAEVSKYYPLQKMILFGSRATGRPRFDSDFDILVVSSRYKEMNVFLRGIELYNYWKLHYPVDFLCYSPQEFEKLKKDPSSIVSEVMEKGIEI